MRFVQMPVALLVAYVASTPTYAQVQPTQGRTIEEIIISASGIRHSPVTPLPASTSDTAGMLRNIPGVDLRAAGGVSSIPGIHGMSGDRVRTKLDGMDLISSCANHMNPPLSYIDPSNVDTVDVLAGITSVSVGGDSIGGTILVNSATPEFSSSEDTTLTKGQGGTFYRSNGDSYGGNVSATLASKRLSLTYDGATAQADNYKAGSDFKPAGPAAVDRGFLPGDEVGSSYYDSTNQFLSLGLQQQNHVADLKVRYQRIWEQGFPNQRMDMTDNKAHSINLGDKATFDWGILESRVYYEKTRHSMNFGDDKQFMYGDAPGMPMETDGKNIGASVKAANLLSSRDILRTGLEFQAYQLDDWWPPSGTGMMMSPNTFENINNGQRDRYALFGEWESRWSEQWTTILGARAELVRMNTGEVQGYSNTNGMGMMMHYYLAESEAFNASDRKRDDENLDVTALTRYTVDPTLTLETGFARKTRSPNLYERYTWSTSGMSMLMVNLAGDGNGYVGNLDLDPETANTLSATANWHDAGRERWDIAITPYLTYVDDFIDAERCVSKTAACGPANQTATDAFVYLQFVNQNARIYGVDLSGSYLALQHRDLGDFTLSGLAGYTSGENRRTNDNLYNIMPLNAKVSLEQRVGNWTNVLEAQFVADKDDVSAVRNEIETGSYNVYSLRSSYQWKQLRIDVGVENLTDEFYDLPLGGAYVGQGKTMSGDGVPWGIAVPGVGRSIYTGLTVTF
jgi:iron complex outermembrane receptor protein